MTINGKIANQVRHILNAAGQIIGYKNPVSDSDEAWPSDAIQALVSKDGNLLLSTALLIGDSLTAQGYPTTNESTSALNWLALACAELGGCFTSYVNGGASGENTTEILARVPALLAANSPTVVVFGPNSVNDLADSLTSATTIANLQAMFDLALAYPGVRWVVISTIHPIVSLTQAAVGAGSRRRYYRAVETFLRSYATANAGRVKLSDFAAAITNTDGSASVAGYVKADDTHLNYQGAYRVAKLAVKPWLREIDKAQWLMPTLTVDHTNLLGPIGIPTGDNASGAAGYANLTGITGTGPNGWNSRRYSGDGATAGVSSMVASPVDLPNSSAQLVATVGAAYGGCGYAIGREASSKNRFDNTRANSTAYTFGERITVGAGAWTRELCGQVFTAGTSSGTAPDFTAVIPGDMVTDGTVVWLITERPLPGDTILMEADLSISYTSGTGAHVGVWAQIISSTAQTADRYLNYAADALATTMPTVADSARRLYRQTFVIPATHVDVRTLPMVPTLWGQSATCVANLQVHRCSLRRIG